MEICFNSESAVAFFKLPRRVREFIAEEQSRIDQLVRLYNPDAVSTSGYRCPSYNFSLANSLPNSNHCVGAARDYKKDSIICTRIKGLKAIIEKGCIHFEPD